MPTKTKKKLWSTMSWKNKPMKSEIARFKKESTAKSLQKVNKDVFKRGY